MEKGDGDANELEYRALNALGAILDQSLNGEAKGDDRKTGFMLLIFEFGEKEGRCNFVYNGADRKDLVTILKRTIARFEQQTNTNGTP